MAIRCVRLSLLPVVLLCLVGLSTSGCAPSETDPRPESAPETGEEVSTAAPRSVPVRVLQVEPEAVSVEAEWPGELRTSRRASLAIEVAGVVKVRPVQEGQRVDADQVLLEVDTRDLEQRLAEAEAVDRQRRAQLTRAEALLERRSITQAQFLDALTNRDVASARLASARLELEKSALRAPWRGRVAAVHVEVGDFVSPGRVVLELLDERLEMWASAPSSDAPHLAVGQSATVGLDAFPGELFEARLVRLGAELDSASRTLDVIASIDGASGRLRPGFTGRLRVGLRQLDSALLAPLDAVVDLGGERAVYVVANGLAEQRRVQTGAVIGADRVVIEQGLQAGDLLIVRGQRQISPGQPVEPESHDD